jgi:2,5-dichloro-2,5-cyclohexadiene-1,4-diol dehydrogenase 1
MIEKGMESAVDSIRGRSIIVTGGASGIGEAAARLLAAHGAKVTIADRNAEAGDALTARLQGQGGAVQFVRTDIALESDVVAMVAAAIRAYGRLDGAFNNAARPPCGKPVGEMTEAEFRAVMDVNVVGTFLCMKHEIQSMLKTGRGSIVNTASVNSIIYTPDHVEYTASKHAVSGLTKGTAVDYGKRGIRVNCIAPGSTKTDMYFDFIKRNPSFADQVAATHPLEGRASEPMEQAQAALWLLSDASSYVTGTTLLVDGGLTIL